MEALTPAEFAKDLQANLGVISQKYNPMHPETFDKQASDALQHDCLNLRDKDSNFKQSVRNELGKIEDKDHSLPEVLFSNDGSIQAPLKIEGQKSKQLMIGAPNFRPFAY